jgi:tetratricopeptide (TPR) repeat protein
MDIDALLQKACQSVSRNLSMEKWQSLLSGEPYQRTCKNRPLHPSFLKIVQGQIRQDDFEGAKGRVEKALQGESDSEAETTQAAGRLVAPMLVARGKELVQSGKVIVSVAAFSEAQDADPDLELPALAWHQFCWQRILYISAFTALNACDKAVTLAPDNGAYRDSRGVARAMLKDYSSAIEDFQRYIEWGPENGESQERIRLHYSWIETLRADKNPFDRAVLRQLREEWEKS